MKGRFRNFDICLIGVLKEEKDKMGVKKYLKKFWDGGGGFWS